MNLYIEWIGMWGLHSKTYNEAKISFKKIKGEYPRR